MADRIEYVLADPEGNKTILVLTPVERDMYREVTGRLLDECPEAEQLGFVKDPVEYEGKMIPHMEMSGLEFCGNASRAFAYYEALVHEPPLHEITVKVSGSDKPLKAWADAKECRSKIEMPVPLGMKQLVVPDVNGGEIRGNLVEMEGIAHLVLIDVEPDEKTFHMLKDHVYENVEDYPAFGVMFIDVASDKMTPVVYVRDVDTVYFEGSCASGTVACAYSMTATCCVPVRTHVFRQPAGTLEVEVHVAGGQVSRMILDGGISISEKMISEK